MNDFSKKFGERVRNSIMNSKIKKLEEESMKIDNVRELISKRINAQNILENLKKELDFKRQQVELQRQRAKEGKSHTLAFEEQEKVKLELIHQEAKVELANLEAEIEIIKLTQTIKSTRDNFICFNKYFDEYWRLTMYNKNLLFQFKEPTMEYFQEVRKHEGFISEIASDFMNEIRNNIIDFETKSKIKLYLEQIQSKLNTVYEFIEYSGMDRLSPFLLHSSIPSIQNLIRDIGIKNGIQIIGDEILQPNKKSTTNTAGSNDKKEHKEPTLKELALYHVYLDTKINKDNANQYLENTSHTAGSKLKQHFDLFTNSNNRTAGSTDRANNHKIKLYQSVIVMLKKTDNEEALKKAEKDFIKFQENIA